MQNPSVIDTLDGLKENKYRKMLLQAMADPRLSSLEPANFPGPTELLVHIILNGGPLQLTAFAKHLNMGLHQYSDQKVKHDNYLDATNQFIHFLFQ